jgi:hypothetical protein
VRKQKFQALLLCHNSGTIINTTGEPKTKRINDIRLVFKLGLPFKIKVLLKENLRSKKLKTSSMLSIEKKTKQ